MTLHTDRSAATSLLVGNTRVYRALVSMVVAMTIVLTALTAAQAAVVNNVLEGNGPQYPSIRQVERAAEVEQNAQQYPSIRQVERTAQVRDNELRQLEANETRRFRNRAEATTSNEVATPTTQDLQRMEYNELRRFRNRAPAWALPALDAEIERLRQVVEDGS